MNIPDEAVEAALEVFWDKEDLPYMEAMRAAITAIAPELMAVAWEEGCAEGFERGDDPQRLEGWQPNPYRSDEESD